MNTNLFRIAFLGPAPPFRGGISKFANTMALYFASRGHSTKHFTFVSQYPKALFPSSGQIDKCKSDLPTERVFTPYLPNTWSKAIKRLQQFKPDIVFISYWIPFMAPAFGWIARKLLQSGNAPPKIVLIAHNIDFHEKWVFADKLSLYLLEKMDRILLLSNKSLSDVKLLFPSISSSKLIRGFHPLYDGYKKSTTLHASEIKSLSVLFFGFIKAYKGLDILLEAIKIVSLSIPSIKLIIAGDVYGDRSYWDNLIESLGIDKYCDKHFRYISDEEVEDFFLNAKLCVLPYRSATQSGVIATSYAFDLPVIASNVGGLSEYIEDGVTGFLVDPESPNALAKAIIEYFDSDLESIMRDNIKKYKTKYSWETLCNRILESI